MSEIDPKQIVSDVLRDDENPPSEDYSPFDYGRKIAEQMNDDALRFLVVESIRRLPGSLAKSFLDGVLASGPLDSLEDARLEALPLGREIGSASAIIEILWERRRITKLALAAHLLSKIQQVEVPNAQDLYAYAILITLGKGRDQGSTREGEPNKMSEDSIQVALSKISTDALTKYAREIIMRCRAGV